MTDTQEPTKTIDQIKQILRISDCPTLSSNSNLTYHIGCDADKSIHFRITANTGGGFYSNEWIALLDIEAVFSSWPVDDPLTATALINLFKGKSANNPAFLMAILKEEGIVATLEGKSRSHEYIEPPTEFMAAMDKLIKDNVYLKVDEPVNAKPSIVKKSAAKPRKKPIKQS